MSFSDMTTCRLTHQNNILTHYRNNTAMFNFISFGSGSSGNCYLLYTTEEAVMIDAGVGIRSLRKSMHDYGITFDDKIKAILLTHDHTDHVKSVGSMSEKLNLPVYATPEVHAGIERNYCVKRKVAPCNRHMLEKGTAIDIAGFEITPIGVPHDSSDNVGYVIRRDGITFSFFTDAGHVTEEMAHAIRHSDYLVIEANYSPELLASGHYPLHLQERIRNGYGHLSNTQCADTLARCYDGRLRHVWLCHLSEENNHPDIARNTVADRLRGEGIGVDSDLRLTTLRRRLPTGAFCIE